METSNNPKDKLPLEKSEPNKNKFSFVTPNSLTKKNTAIRETDAEYIIFKLIKKYYKYDKVNLWIQNEISKEEKPKSTGKSVPIICMVIVGYLYFYLYRKGKI